MDMNLTLERQKFYAEHDFQRPALVQDMEVVYTWEMDLNRSVLGAATVLVPRAPPAPAPTAASAAAAGMPPWAQGSWVVYTWEMDLNRSVLGAATVLVPRAPPAPAPTAASAAAAGMPPWAQGSWVVYTWEMDLNRSVLGAATVLVPRAPPAPAPTAASVAAAGMPPWAQGSWVCLYATMLAVAICGNAIVIWIVTAHRRMRTVTNYFLVNLSFADLMMSSLNCLFNFIYMLHSDWVFGVRYCQLSNFIANVTVAASVFTLTGISFDRFQAIVRPMRPRMSKSMSLIMIAGIWASGMVLAVPCLLYSSTITYAYGGLSKTACVMVWPDGLPDVSYMDFVYQVLFFVVTYAVPMLGMTFFYSAMGRVLWGSRSIGELTQRQLDSIRSKRKVVKMFILVIGIFGICWLPYQSYFIYLHFEPRMVYRWYIQHVYLGFYWLAMANAMVNPIIYYWMNAKFRSYFRTAMCGWRAALRRPKRGSAGDSPPADRHSHSGSRSRSERTHCSGIAEERKDSKDGLVSRWRGWSVSDGYRAPPSPRQRSRASAPPAAAAYCPPYSATVSTPPRYCPRLSSPTPPPPPPPYVACCNRSHYYVGNVHAITALNVQNATSGTTTTTIEV